MALGWQRQMPEVPSLDFLVLVHMVGLQTCCTETNTPLLLHGT